MSSNRQEVYSVPLCKRKSEFLSPRGVADVVASLSWKIQVLLLRQCKSSGSVEGRDHETRDEREKDSGNSCIHRAPQYASLFGIAWLDMVHGKTCFRNQAKQKSSSHPKRSVYTGRRHKTGTTTSICNCGRGLRPKTLARIFTMVSTTSGPFLQTGGFCSIRYQRNVHASKGRGVRQDRQH